MCVFVRDDNRHSVIHTECELIISRLALVGANCGIAMSSSRRESLQPYPLSPFHASNDLIEGPMLHWNVLPDIFVLYTVQP